MILTLEEKVLEHKDGHYMVQDWMGNIDEISEEYDYTYLCAPKDLVTRKWHKFPVTNRQGVDKRCIAKGGQTIENELALLEPVIKDGSFTPGCDHGMPHDFLWQNFVYYSRLLVELTDWVGTCNLRRF